MDSSRNNSESLKSNTLAANISSPGGEDRLDSKMRKMHSFLVDVRTAALGSVSPLRPTWKTYYEVFRILRYSVTPETCLESFNLLTDLDKRYPGVYLNHSDSSGTDSSGGAGLMMDKEAWSPFTFESENFYDEATTPCSDRELLIDSEYFSFLMEDIAHGSYSSFMLVDRMLLFQYLVSVLEEDYLSHQTAYNRTLNWNFLRDSAVCLLLASRKMNYRNLVQNCMSIASKSFFHEINISLEDLKGSESTSVDLSQSYNVGPSYVFPKFRKKTCVAAHKFLILIMELDLNLKEAEKSGFTSRAPVLETIIDQLTYNRNQIFSFLEVFGEPKWKLEIILMYLGKYCKKEVHKIKKEYPDECTKAEYLALPTTNIRRTNDLPSDGTLQSILNFFSNPTISCGILREVTFPVVFFLLAQAFMCYLSLQPDPKNAIFLTRLIGESTLLEVCSDLLSTFSCISGLKRTTFPFTSFEMEVLLMAKSIRRRILASEIIPKLG